MCEFVYKCVCSHAYWSWSYSGRLRPLCSQSRSSNTTCRGIQSEQQRPSIAADTHTHTHFLGDTLQQYSSLSMSLNRSQAGTAVELRHGCSMYHVWGFSSRFWGGLRTVYVGTGWDLLQHLWQALFVICHDTQLWLQYRWIVGQKGTKSKRTNPALNPFPPTPTQSIHVVYFFSVGPYCLDFFKNLSNFVLLSRNKTVWGNLI